MTLEDLRARLLANEGDLKRLRELLASELSAEDRVNLQAELATAEAEHVAVQNHLNELS